MRIDGVSRAEWVVIGGGFAGIATAAALVDGGAGPGVVLEREALCGTHASGRNAGIFRLVEHDPVIAALARRSRQLLSALPGVPPIVMPVGGLTVADATRVAEVSRTAAALQVAGLRVDMLSMAAARRRFPAVHAFTGEAVLWCPDEGVLDIHALLTSFVARARRGGVVVATRSAVDELVWSAGRVDGVRLGTHEIRAPIVIDATGAWAGQFGLDTRTRATRPYRRHLVACETSRPFPRAAPFVWAVGEDELYARRDGHGLLLSPCDQTPWTGGAVATDAAAVEWLARRVEHRAPGLDDLAVRRVWACLRTFTADGRPLVGPDPEVPGLFHVAGLGGFGATCSAAIGELAAAVITCRKPTDARLGAS